MGEMMAKVENKKCDVQICIVRRFDGLYTVRLSPHVKADKVTGCDWGEVQRLLRALEPLTGLGQNVAANGSTGQFGGSRPRTVQDSPQWGFMEAGETVSFNIGTGVEANSAGGGLGLGTSIADAQHRAAIAKYADDLERIRRNT